MLTKKHASLNLDESSESSDSSSAENEDSEESKPEAPPQYDFGLKCNRGFLNAYGIDGLDDAHMNGMTLCEDIKYSCCSPIDELKFHKNWYGYYEVKLRETHKRMTENYKRLAKILEFFKALPVKEHKKVIKNGRFKEAEQVHKLLEKGGIDPELHPILDELENLNKRDHKEKKGVFCMFCNYDNHEFLGMNGGTVMIHQKSCEDIIQDAGLMLQIRNKLLQPLIMLVHKLLGLYAVNYYDRVEWDLIREARMHMDLVNMCFPTENAEFVLDNCKGICNRFNMIENSEIIFGEFELYSYLIERVDKFEEWLPLALKNPKKHVKQWVKEEEVEEEDKKEGEKDKKEEGKEGEEEKEEENKIRRRILSSKRRKKRKRHSELRASHEDDLEIYNENQERILSLRKLRKMAKRKRKKLKLQKNYKKSHLDDDFLTNKILEVEMKIRKYKSAIHKMKKDNKKIMKKISKNKKYMEAEIRKSLKKEKNFFADPIESRKIGFEKSRHIHVFQHHKRSPVQLKRTRKRTSKKSRDLATTAPQTNEEEPEEEESIIYKDPNILPKKNEDCQNCSSSIGSIDSSDIQDSEYIYRSQRITTSKFLEDSMDCVDCAHGTHLKNCTNVTHSNFTTDSKHVTKSLNVSNSTLVENSTFVKNSKNVKDSSKITNSTKIKLSNNCINCHNCFNCTACVNVTNCSNCHNVTHSINVTNAEHSSKIFDSSDILHGFNLTNATNMTNASNCAECKNRENCQGKACNEPVKSEYEIALENKIYYTTMDIVERLYGMTNIGDAGPYVENPNDFDPYLYRANNFLYDLSRYRSIFDEDGIVLDFRTTEKFVKDKKEIVEAAVEHFIKSDKDYKHNGIKVGKVDAEFDEFDIRIADLVNNNSDFLSVHHFLRDAKKGVISYKSMQGKNELELQAYDEYLEVIGQEEGGGIIECQEGNSGFEDCLNKRRMVELVLKQKQIEEEEKALEEIEKKKEEEGGKDEGEGGENAEDPQNEGN